MCNSRTLLRRLKRLEQRTMPNYLYPIGSYEVEHFLKWLLEEKHMCMATVSPDLNPPYPREAVRCSDVMRLWHEYVTKLRIEPV